MADEKQDMADEKDDATEEKKVPTDEKDDTTDEKKDPLQDRIDRLEKQLKDARKAKRARDARERRKAAKKAKEARAREAEELLSFLESHVVTYRGRKMTGLVYFEEVRKREVFSPLSDDESETRDSSETSHVEDVTVEHGTEGQDMSDSQRDSDMPPAGITIDTIMSSDARDADDEI